MVTPSLLGFIILVYFPIIYILQYAFFNYNGWEKSFAGFGNFVRLFTRDPDYWASVGTTFILAFGKLAVEIPLALFLAVLLSKKMAGAGFFRVALFLPAIISTAIVGLIFTLMFGAYDGIINVILADLHLIK
jgi:ABC-type sugar transport system permease subunit